MNYDDAFTIEEVPTYRVSIINLHEYTTYQVVDSLVQKFNCVAEVIPIIKAYTEEVRTNKDNLWRLSSSNAYNYAERGKSREAN